MSLTRLIPLQVYQWGFTMLLTSPQMTTCTCVFTSSDSTPGVPVRVHNVTNKSTHDHMYLCLWLVWFHSRCTSEGSQCYRQVYTWPHVLVSLTRLIPLQVYKWGFTMLLTSLHMTTCTCVFNSSDSTLGVPVRVHNVTNKSTHDHMYLCL